VQQLTLYQLQRSSVDVFHVLQGYKPPDESSSEYQSIPLNKIEDFGVHCKQYVQHLWHCPGLGPSMHIHECLLNKRQVT
jgi:hypothetical protein